ncbi:MAG: aminoacyl-tRNA hydrolase, partial [Anaerolineae bacterium]
MPLSFPLFGRSKKKPGPVRWLVVGLGNPGRKYAGTRHNAGFHVLDRLAAAEDLRFDERRNKALLARGRISGVGVALVKPQTYMNLSGEAVGPLARFYKVPPERILVIFDDLDLPLAAMKLRLKGGSGGHNGLESVIAHLGTKDFPRLRLGVGRPPGRMPPKAYLLQPFSDEQWSQMVETYDQAVEAVRAALAEG